MRWKEINY